MFQYQQISWHTGYLTLKSKILNIMIGPNIKQLRDTQFY